MSNFSNDLMKTMQTLIKYNGGLYKSIAQKCWMDRMRKYDAPEFMFDPAHAGYVGFPKAEYIYVEQNIMWADYGNRSRRSVIKLFQMDQYGIVKAWKLHRKYSPDGLSSSLNTEKYEVIFERSEDVDTSALQKSIQEKLAKEEAQLIEKSMSSHIGQVGDKVTVEGEVMFAKMTNGYYPSFMISVKTDDKNVVVWFSANVHDVKSGDRVELIGRVKSHGEFNSAKQTVITRAKMKVLSTA